jgi:CHAT domain-containing protein/predicted negative regulator of RcsB-dependent stress response
MRRLLILVLVSCLSHVKADTADSQEVDLAEGQFEVLRGIASGEGVQTLALYEARAVEFEKMMQSAALSETQLLQAVRNYRLAALTARYLGNFEKSFRYAEKMLSLCNKLGNAALTIQALNELHNAHLGVHDFTRAAQVLDIAFQLLSQLRSYSLERFWWHSRLYKHKGDLLRRQPRLDEAVDAYRQSIEAMDEYLTQLVSRDRLDGRSLAAAQGLQVNSYVGLGGAYYRLGKLELALASYKRGLEISKEWSSETTQTNLYRGIGEVRFSQGEFGEALANFKKSLELARRDQRPIMIVQAARWTARTLVRTGNLSDALVYYREAIRGVESVRSLLADRHNRQLFFDGQTGDYSGIIGVLSGLKKHDSAFDYSERARSRSFLDLLGTKVQLGRQARDIQEQRIALARSIALTGEMRDPHFIRASTEAERNYESLLAEIRRQDREQASLLTVDPLTLNETQTLLEPGQMLLEYFVTQQQVYLWVVGKNQLRSLGFRLSRAELVQNLQILRAAISERRPLTEYQALARQFYQQLIAPAESYIQGKELIIVPHGVLHNLPFHALVGNDGRYLIEKYPVHYLSSASLMQFTQAKRRALGQRVLAFGNPAVESVEELKFAERETAEVKKLFPATTQLLRSEATKDKVKALAHDYDILHFATHTELKQDDPLSSAVILARSATDDGRLEVRDIFGLDLKASLVVLSGCETALGKLSSGDELVGLTRAFIYAGTPSVVASLWKVDDASTASLMSSFYKNLKTKSKVEALRQAQLDMIRGKVNAQLLAQRGVGGIGKLSDAPSSAIHTPRLSSVPTSHPYFWAPFILVGDGK